MKKHILSFAMALVAGYAGTPAFAQSDHVFRQELSAPIFFTNSTGGGEVEVPVRTVNISTTLATTSLREFGALSFDVSTSGLIETDVLEVAKPSAAIWTPAALGAGSFSWESASVGDHPFVVTVKDAAGAVLDVEEIMVRVHPVLSAAIPQSTYEVAKGGSFTITPTLSGLITPGEVEWSAVPSPIPAWLDLDEATGRIVVDTTSVNSVSNLRLSAFDRTDSLADDTDPFSISVYNDACTWTLASSTPAFGQWQHVSYLNNQFVALAPNSSNSIFTSPDGDIWTNRGGASGLWRSVAYGNGTYVAVSDTGGLANRVLTSTDNGVTWTPRSVPQTNSWRSVAFGNGVFVAISNDGVNRLMTSTDGVNWALQTPAQRSWSEVIFADNRFVVIANSFSMTSTNGLSWNTTGTMPVGNWGSIAYGNGTYVATVSNTGSSTSNFVATSSNGLNWVRQDLPQTAAWRSVSYGNGKFVALASGSVNGFGYVTSSNGIDWELGKGINSSWYDIAFGNGKFVAVGLSSSMRAMHGSCI